MSHPMWGNLSSRIDRNEKNAGARHAETVGIPLDIAATLTRIEKNMGS